MSKAEELAEQHKGRADDCGELARAILADREKQAARVPVGWKLVPLDVLKAASESLGSFVSDHGWGDADMQAMDNLDAFIASAAPTEPSKPEQAEGDQLAEMEARKDAAYLQRNQVVAALASAYPSGTTKTAIEGWSEDWHGCVYIDLPTGQASWHYHDSQSYLFAHLPAYSKPWDGHTTEQKYERLAALATTPPASAAGEREALVDLIAEHLSGTYHCHRVWSAWHVGTMSEDDFSDVGESDTPAEIADAVLAALASKPLPEQVAQDKIDAERWRAFIGLEYKVRAEWACNLSLVPVLTEWVDQLAARTRGQKDSS